MEELTSAAYEIEIAGKRFPATTSFRPMYDPGNSRIRG
jgi:hypothetical protein